MYVTEQTQNIRIGISDKETYLLSTLAREGKSIVTLEDISRVWGASYSNAKVISNRLRKKRWLLELIPGKYLISPLSAGVESEYTEHEFIIASELVKKKSYYIAYWSALNHYGFTEQTPFTVFVATPSRIKNITVHDVKYQFVTINQAKFFGMRNHFFENKKIIISDKNKTIVDALDHPEYCGGIVEVAKCLWNAKNEISYSKIFEYSQKIKNSTVIKRLGFLIDTLEIKVPQSIYNQMHDSINTGRSWLDPYSTKTKKSNLKWKLFVNVPTELILEIKSNT